MRLRVQVLPITGVLLGSIASNTLAANNLKSASVSFFDLQLTMSVIGSFAHKSDTDPACVLMLETLSVSNIEREKIKRHISFLNNMITSSCSNNRLMMGLGPESTKRGRSEKRNPGKG